MRNLTKLLAGSSAVLAITAMAAAAPAMAAPAARPDTALKISPVGTKSVTNISGVEAPNTTFTASGGTAPYTWSISPAVPSGVWTDASGTSDKTFRVGGTWEVPAGTTSYTVTLTDSASDTKTATLKETIDAAPVAATSTVSVGADTDEYLFDQFSSAYNASSGHVTSLYNFDATDPVTGEAGGTITPKQGCSNAPITRPNGSGAGITALENSGTVTGGSGECIDFARSSSGRTASTSPNISFLALATDAVSYVTLKGSKTHAPAAGLPSADLTGIYNCTPGYTHWNTLPGVSDTNKDTIVPVLPPSTSGVRTFFLAAIGVTTPGSCVVNGVDPSGTATPGATIEQNTGNNAIWTDKSPFNAVTNPEPADLLFPYSVGDWLAEAYHEAKCLNSTCAPVNGVLCIPSTSQNLYGCNQNGSVVLNPIDGTDPTTPWPPTSASVLNISGSAPFNPTFTRTLYDVVDAAEGTQPTGNLETLFGPTGWTCTVSAAATEIKDYGFATLPQGSSPGDCGYAS